MQYISLEEITENDLMGVWEVSERVNSKTDHSLFEDSKKLELTQGTYRAINGKELKGRWLIKREIELIYNPQIEFFIDNELIGEAIITRLFSETVDNVNIHRLTIYFSNGLELVLIKAGITSE